MTFQTQQQIQEKTETKPPIKTNWKLFGVVAMVAVIISVGGILLLKATQPVPVVQIPPPTQLSPQSQAEVLDTSDWQTYHNEEFGFEVRQPGDWKLEDDTHSVFPGFKLQSPQNSSLALYPKGWDIGLGSTPNLKEGTGELGGSRISFISYFTETNEERARFIRFLDGPWDGGWLFLMYKIHDVRTECAVAISPQHPECTLDDGTIFFGDVDDEEKEILNKILSTFRFVDSIDTSDWQTYRNEEIGFEMRYPSDIFTIGPAEIIVDPDFEVPYKGERLIYTNAKEKLSEKECSYEKIGFAMVCDVAKEDGISFIIISKGFFYLTGTEAAGGENEGEITIGGVKGVMYNYGAEGYNTEYYYLPIGPSQTLVITVKSTFNWGLSTSSASKELVDQILSTFKFTDKNILDSTSYYTAKIKSDIQQLRSALELYYSDHRQYPTALTELSPTYIQNLPKSPYDNSSYIYESLKTDYVLSGKLGNGSLYTVRSPL